MTFSLFCVISIILSILLGPINILCCYTSISFIDFHVIFGVCLRFFYFVYTQNTNTKHKTQNFSKKKNQKKIRISDFFKFFFTISQFKKKKNEKKTKINQKRFFFVQKKKFVCAKQAFWLNAMAIKKKRERKMKTQKKKYKKNSCDNAR